jgi:cytosine deaminase
MCTGTALLYRIPRVIVGENRNFMGAEDLFRQNGVEVVVLDDVECVRMMREFIRDHADLWNEDIGK